MTKPIMSQKFDSIKQKKYLKIFLVIITIKKIKVNNSDNTNLIISRGSGPIESLCQLIVL